MYRKSLGPIVGVVLAIPLALLYVVLSIVMAPIVAYAWATGRPTNVPYPLVPLQVIVGHRGRIWVSGSRGRPARVEYRRRSSEGQSASRFEKFSARARRVLSVAQEEAQQFNHNYVGTEHILLGLIRETDGVAARVLGSLSLDLGKVRSAVEQIIGRGERPSAGDIGLTPRAKHAIELAVDEARRHGHRYIGTGHLLIGVVAEGEGVAAGVLAGLGASVDQIRTEFLRMIESGDATDEG